MFQGVEFMREHVRDGVRMHYSIEEAVRPANVVPERAVAKVGLRAKRNEDLEELNSRFRKIVEGACLMTETTADVHANNAYWARKPNKTLAGVALENFRQLGIPTSDPILRESGGSTDFGNVSCIVPAALVYMPYVDATSHSDEWVAAGKTETAERCMVQSAKMLAAIAYDLITSPEIVQTAKEEFQR